jgi:DUF4097 and DUF4098 domain-containing protein YvlB
MRTALLIPVLFASCVYPSFVATKVVEFTVPAATVERLDCETHNGSITVAGDSGRTEIAIRAELSVRGTTQSEADANLNLLEVGREEGPGRLHLFAKYPAVELANRSPNITFSLQVPARIVLNLDSHNGDLRVTGSAATAQMTTHNGSISGSVGGKQLAVETHNGDVVLDLTGAGAIDGNLTSHNGSITVGILGATDATLVAATHNGDIHAGAMVRESIVKKRSLQGRIGDGSGKLAITTHNGDVTIR